MATGSVEGDPGGITRERLAVALQQAMLGKDVVAASALRSALAALGNAEAVPPDQLPAAGIGRTPIAGALAGLGAGEAARRNLSAADIAEIVRTEITERQVAATAYQRSGHAERAERLLREAQVLEAALHG
jgi:uncharacterized protein YqeY